MISESFDSNYKKLQAIADKKFQTELTVGFSATTDCHLSPVRHQFCCIAIDNLERETKAISSKENAHPTLIWRFLSG